MHTLAAVVLAPVFIGLMIFDLFFRLDQLEWSMTQTVFYRTLIDGTRRNGMLMRRKVNGAWQFRVPSAEELDEYQMTTAW